MARTAVLFMIALMALMASWAGCGTAYQTPTGCVVSEGDAGTANNVTCSLEWACNSNTEHYQLNCTLSTPGNVSCVCTSDQTTLSSQILVNDDFVCTGQGALAVVDECGHWDLQM